MNSNCRTRKAQTFMPDYLSSLVVFGLLLAIFMGSWSSVISDQTDISSADSLRVQAIHTSTFLTVTPGYPGDWEENPANVEILGFANPDHVLQEEKLDAFDSISYEEQKRLLQAPDFFLNITTENETWTVRMNGDRLSYGTDYSSADTVIPVTRTVQLNTSEDMKTVKLNYIVWR